MRSLSLSLCLCELSGRHLTSLKTITSKSPSHCVGGGGDAGGNGDGDVARRLGKGGDGGDDGRSVAVMAEVVVVAAVEVVKELGMKVKLRVVMEW